MKTVDIAIIGAGVADAGVVGRGETGGTALFGQHRDKVNPAVAIADGMGRFAAGQAFTLFGAGGKAQ